MHPITKARWNIIADLGMAVFGILALVLTTYHNRWGPVVGLVSQPFFYLSAVIHRQWGFLILSLAYTVVWLNGIRINFG